MKNLYYLSMIFACVTLFSACKKSGTDAQDDNSPKKYISKISWTNNGTPQNTDFTYNEKKQLTRVKSGSVVNDYIYNTDGSLFSFETYPPNSYAFRNVCEMRYEGGNLREVKRIRFNGNAIVDLEPWKFAYEGSRMTVRQVDGYDVLFSYDAKGNTIEEKASILTAKRSFDDKKSIYTNFPAALKKIGNQIAQSEYSCPNNPLSVSIISGVTNTTNYTYTYDKDGYPTSATTNTNGNVTTFTYTYVEL